MQRFILITLSVLAVAICGCGRKVVDDGTGPENQGTGGFQVTYVDGNEILEDEQAADAEHGTDWGLQPPGGETVSRLFSVGCDPEATAGFVVQVGLISLTDFTLDGEPITEGELPFEIASNPGNASYGPDEEATTGDLLLAFTPPVVAGVYAAVCEINYTDPEHEEGDRFTFALQAEAGFDPADIEIAVFGREGDADVTRENEWVEIATGSTEASTGDGTHFGNFLPDEVTPVSHIFRIESTGLSDLTLGNPSVALVDASDEFRITEYPATLIPGESASVFEITYSPDENTVNEALPIRSATVRIRSNDADEDPYTFVIQATTGVPKLEVYGQGIVVELDPAGVPVSEALGTEFGQLPIGSANSLYFRMKNGGSGMLNLIDQPVISVSGNHPQDFTVVLLGPSTADGQRGDDTLTELQPDAETYFRVDFSPSELGARTAVVKIANDSLDEERALYTINIGGEGYQPPIEVFGDFNRNGLGPMDAPEPGADPGAYQESDSLEGVYWLHPSRRGADLLNSSVISEDNNTNFGDAAVGESTDVHRFYIYNPTSATTLTFTGDEPVTIQGDQSADFSVIQQPTKQSLAPGERASFLVSFAPIDYGYRLALVSIRHDASRVNPFVFGVAGMGLASDIQVIGPNGLPISSGDFEPSIEDGTFDPDRIPVNGFYRIRTYTVINRGNKPLTFTGSPRVEVQCEKRSLSGFSPWDYVFWVPREDAANGYPLPYDFGSIEIYEPEPNVATLEPGQSTTFRLFQNPIKDGYNDGTLTIRCSDPDEPVFNFAIRCIGSAPLPKIQGAGRDIPDGDFIPDYESLTHFGQVDGGHDDFGEDGDPNAAIDATFGANLGDPIYYDHDNNPGTPTIPQPYSGGSASYERTMVYTIENTGDDDLTIFNREELATGADSGAGISPMTSPQEWVYVEDREYFYITAKAIVSNVNPATPDGFYLVGWLNGWNTGRRDSLGIWASRYQGGLNNVIVFDPSDDNRIAGVSRENGVDDVREMRKGDAVWILSGSEQFNQYVTGVVTFVGENFITINNPVRSNVRVETNDSGVPVGVIVDLVESFRLDKCDFYISRQPELGDGVTLDEADDLVLAPGASTDFSVSFRPRCFNTTVDYRPFEAYISFLHSGGDLYPSGSPDGIYQFKVHGETNFIDLAVLDANGRIVPDNEDAYNATLATSYGSPENPIRVGESVPLTFAIRNTSASNESINGTGHSISLVDVEEQWITISGLHEHEFTVDVDDLVNEYRPDENEFGETVIEVPVPEEDADMPTFTVWFTPSVPSAVDANGNMLPREAVVSIGTNDGAKSVYLFRLTGYAVAAEPTPAGAN